MLQTNSGFLGEPGETAKQGRRLPQFSPAMTPNCKHTQENHLPKLTHVVSAPVCRVSPSSLKKNQSTPIGGEVPAAQATHLVSGQTQQGGLPSHTVIGIGCTRGL